jgi:hypothetical protein
MSDKSRKILLENIICDEKNLCKAAILEDDPKAFFNSLPTEYKNEEMKFLLSSTNCIFLDLLNDESKEIFFTAEILEFTDLKMDETIKGIIIKVDTMSGEIHFYGNSISDNDKMTLDRTSAFIDNYGNVQYIKQDTAKLLVDTLLSEISKKDPSFTGKNFNDLYKYTLSKGNIKKSKISEYLENFQI